MNTAEHGTLPPLSEVMNDLALAQEKPDAELLEEFTRRYPAYAEQLTDYAIELAIQFDIDAAALPPSQTPETSAAAMRAMSRFQNRQFELRAPPSSGSTTTARHNPFASLSTKQMRSVVEALGITSPLLIKLRDRLIRGETIPEWFRLQLAEKLGVPIAVLDEYLAGPPNLPAAASFKAEGKPQRNEKEAFLDAVAGAGLDAEQQAALQRP